MYDLTSLWYDAFQGKPVSDAAIEFAERHLTSSDPVDEIKASAILFLSGNSTQRNRAVKNVQSACKQSRIDGNPLAKALLMSLLERFPSLDAPENSCFMPLVYSAIKDPYVPLRLNAIHVLRYLALKDAVAMQLLSEACHDPNRGVADTAQIALKLIAEAKRRQKSNNGSHDI